MFFIIFFSFFIVLWLLDALSKSKIIISWHRLVCDETFALKWNRIRCTCWDLKLELMKCNKYNQHTYEIMHHFHGKDTISCILFEKWNKDKKATVSHLQCCKMFGLCFHIFTQNKTSSIRKIWMLYFLMCCWMLESVISVLLCRIFLLLLLNGVSVYLSCKIHYDDNETVEFIAYIFSWCIQVHRNQFELFISLTLLQFVQ